MTINLNMLKFYFFTNRSSLKPIARLYQQSSQGTYFFVCVKSNNYMKDGRPSFLICQTHMIKNKMV